MNGVFISPFFHFRSAAMLKGREGLRLPAKQMAPNRVHGMLG